MHSIDDLRSRARALITHEAAAFRSKHPISQSLSERAGAHYPGGVPLHWMLDWATPFPLSIARAEGAAIQDADGLAYVDFCLGDGAALFGHSPAAVARAITEQASRGLTAMLPGADTGSVGEALAKRFGLPFWQMTATASDANRAVIRWSRAITGRPKLLVFDGCYHGQVDETFVSLTADRSAPKPSLIGPIPGATADTIVIDFNDIEALETALADGEVALILTEPALTNTGMVLPEQGFLEAVQRLARRSGALFCLDETHTIASGPGGYGAGHGIAPDFLVVGKPIAGGVPAAVFGFTAAIEAAMQRVQAVRPSGYSGIGTTLSGNLLAMAAMRACLAEVMTDANYQHMIGLAETLADRLAKAIESRKLPWSVVRLGARVELVFRDRPPRTGAEARAALDDTLERALHLYLINRGVILTPFHNMMLVSPATRREDIERVALLMAEVFDILTGAEEALA